MWNVLWGRGCSVSFYLDRPILHSISITITICGVCSQQMGERCAPLAVCLFLYTLSLIYTPRLSVSLKYTTSLYKFFADNVYCQVHVVRILSKKRNLVYILRSLELYFTDFIGIILFPIYCTIMCLHFLLRIEVLISKNLNDMKECCIFVKLTVSLSFN
jgi:hypothetical protein